MLIDRGFYGSHIKICWVGLRGLGCRVGGCVLFFENLFFFYFAAAAAAGARMCKNFSLCGCSRWRSFFFVDKFLVEI